MNEAGDIGAMVMAADGLGRLIGHLQADGYRVIAPVVRDGAVLYDEIETPKDLARGWRIDAGPGRYRLTREETAHFDHVIGPTPWKRFLHPPRETLLTMRRDGDGITVDIPERPTDKLAFLGIRPCDLAALAVLDRAMMGGPNPDPRYAARRANTLLIAANCRIAADTCFCASMGTGPRVETGFDLALSELGDGPETRFLVEAGSAAGERVAEALAGVPADAADLATARDGAAKAAAMQTRAIDPNGLPQRLRAAAEHPHWDEVATRCLNCTNCTMVCPTCFCSTMEEVDDLTTGETRREQRWDSCFTLEFSHVHGGSVRPSPKARYRQWLTHKLGTWPEQFDGDLGCTGCGRCIAWCPVGIDLTEEIPRLTEPAS